MNHSKQFLQQAKLFTFTPDKNICIKAIPGLKKPVIVGQQINVYNTVIEQLQSVMLRSKFKIKLCQVVQ